MRRTGKKIINEPDRKKTSRARIIGTPTPRLEGPEKVSGKAIYASDVCLPGMELIPASSEQEAVTIAVGATLGGKQGAVYMENTGVYVSSYSLLVTGKQLGVPILLVIGYLGGVPDQRNSFLYATIGKHTVPVLEGLGIEYQIIEDGQKLENKIRDAVRAANGQRAPYALLFAGEFSE